MRSGDLDQIITLYSLAETNDEGSLDPTLTSVGDVFGKVISQRGSEAFEAARVNARETIRVQIYYRADVTTKWRLEWMGQKYRIITVDRSLHRQGELWLTAEAVGAL